MEKINLNDIEFSALEMLHSQGTKSTIYTDGNLCYKILDGLYPSEKKDLYKKFLDMEGIKVDNVLLPQDLIVDDGVLLGYTMPYFKNSKPLSEQFLKRYFNCKELFDYVDKASKILRNIHSNGIICQDLSFDNILVDNKGKIAFCDIDGCCYKENSSPFFSKLFVKFLIDWRKSKICKEDVDNVSMILWLCYIMYGEVLQNITKRQYHILSDNIHTLENLRYVVNILVDKNCIIKNIPYLDEFIDLTDDYEIDRKKVLNLKQRIFRKF